jgi:hypothetical protein
MSERKCESTNIRCACVRAQKFPTHRASIFTFFLNISETTLDEQKGHNSWKRTINAPLYMFRIFSYLLNHSIFCFSSLRNSKLFYVWWTAQVFAPFFEALKNRTNNSESSIGNNTRISVPLGEYSLPFFIPFPETSPSTITDMLARHKKFFDVPFLDAMFFYFWKLWSLQKWWTCTIW